MGKYILQKKDFEEIAALINVTTAISNDYKALYNLETNGKKDTEEYKKVLDNLHMDIEFENKLYNEYYHLNYDKCYAWIEYLFENQMPKELKKDIESMMEQDYSNRVIIRILNTLINKMTEDYQNIKKIIPEEVIELLKQLGMPNPDKLASQSAYSNIKIQESLEIDTLNAYLSILQEYIQKEDYRSFRNQLINSKYNITFINKEIEKGMLSNNFDIPETLYINSKMIADLHQVDSNIYDLLKDHYSIQISAKQISEIIEISDMDYSDQNKATTSILRQCLMRASFLLMSDDAISNVNYTFHEFIEGKEYLDRHPNDRISEQLIINCFRSIKKDKNKPNILSLTYRKN